MFVLSQGRIKIPCDDEINLAAHTVNNEFHICSHKMSTEKLRPNQLHVLLIRHISGSDRSPIPAFMSCQAYQGFLLWLQSNATLPGQVAPPTVVFKYFAHNKLQPVNA